MKHHSETETFLKEVKLILKKLKKTDNIRLKAIFEKLDLYIKSYNSIQNPLPSSEPSAKMKDIQLKLDEAIS